MKKLSRLFTAAFIFFAAAACGIKEIDHPDNPDNPQTPDTPQDSEFTITASIVKTRVSYYDIDADLDQKWDVGDVLFGYYDRSVEHKVILYVSDVDKEGNATLTPVSGDGFATLNDLAGLGPSVPVDVVYTGANVTSSNYPFDDSGNLTVDMHSQNGVRIPACMHARASVDTDKKTLSFEFINDCAILEIYSLTGLKDDDINLSNDVALTSLSVTNLYLEGKYTLGKDGFELGPTNIDEPGKDPVLTRYEANFGDNGVWKVTKNAEIKNGSTVSRYLIAVVPNSVPATITVSATAEGVLDSFGHQYGDHALEADKCYVIHEADVVAKTVDGLYFTTVADAFAHAAEIAAAQKTSPELYDGKNIVTLIKQEIDGLGPVSQSWWSNEDISPKEQSTYDVASMIVINYDVTLDLNGCTLYLNYSRGPSGNIIIDDESKDPVPSDGVTSGAFYVSSGKSFKIQDSSEGDGECRSCSNCTLVINKGNTIVSSGNVYHTLNSSAVHNYGNLTVEGGNVYSVYGNAIINDGNASITGGLVDANYLTILNNKSLKVLGGDVCSYCHAAIQSTGDVVIGDSIEQSSVSISGAADAAIICSDGALTVYYGEVIGDYDEDDVEGSYIPPSAVHLYGGVTCDIYGGYFESYSPLGTLYIHDGPECTISGGTIYNKNTDDYSFPAVYFFSDTDDGTTLEVKWPENTGNDGNGYIINVEGNHEPLLYSSGRNKYCSPIRKSRSNLMTDYSTLSILGGYLVSNNNAFYAQDIVTTIPSDPMDNNYFDGFYSNASAFHYDADKSAPLDTPGHKLYSEYNASAAGDGFNIDTITSSPPSGKMYKITGPAQTGSTDPYIFKDFEW